MDQSEIFIRILFTIIFGGILGLETETREIEKQGEKKAEKEEKERIGGVRTYTVLSLFGGIAGIFYSQQQFALVYILFFAVIALILAAYILNVQVKHAFGLTTEIAILITFILGFLTTSAIVPISLVLIILILLTFFLSQKRGIGLLIKKIGHNEVIDVIKFALVAVVVLPVLPNRDYFLSDLINLLGLQTLSQPSFTKVVIINPFQIWAIVVIISGINLLGYFLSRLIGKSRGLFITAVLGGLISSTSAIISFAGKSKTDKIPDTFAGAAIISNAVSFFLLLLLLFISSKDLFYALSPFILLMLISGLIIGVWIILTNKRKSTTKEFEVKYEPFSIGPALKFVSLIIIIKLVIQVLQILNVNNEVLIGITALSGVIGMDAQTIAFGGLVQSGIITVGTGVFAFMLANYINFAAKSVYSYFTGSRKFFVKVLIGLIISGVIGLLGIFLI